MFDLRCSRPAVSMSMSISFWPSTIATRSSSACVALNSMRFISTPCAFSGALVSAGMNGDQRLRVSAVKPGAEPDVTGRARRPSGAHVQGANEPTHAADWRAWLRFGAKFIWQGSLENQSRHRAAAEPRGLFHSVHFGGTRTTRIHAVGGCLRLGHLAAYLLRIQRDERPSRNPRSRMATREPLLTDQASRAAVRRHGPKLQSLACEVFPAPDRSRNCGPRRASVGASRDPWAAEFSGTPEKPRRLKYMQDGHGP